LQIDWTMTDPATLAFVAVAYLLAGTVKGVIGLGLPTVSIGILTLVLSPAEAAAVLIVPSFATNIWQMLHGPHFAALVKRLWTLLAGVLAGVWLTAGVLTNAQSGTAVAGLGAALILYAAIGLSSVRLTVPRRAEPWLSPLVGVSTGAVLGATGVFVIPAIPYLQALDLDRDELVQAMGLSFTVSTVALTAILAGNGLFRVETAGLSALAVVPAIVGMVAGRRIRARVDAAMFRRLFFVGMLGLGLHLVVRAVL
jgi:uncharacterized protein